MLPHRIIGLAGPAGVGKTTTANALELALGYERHSFAGPLKEVAQRFFGVDIGVLHRVRAHKAAGISDPGLDAAAAHVRADLWRIGKGMLALGPGCLERAAMSFADTHVDASGRQEGLGLRPEDRVVRSWLDTRDVLFPKVVFDDVRRPGEIEAILERDGVVVWLEGPTAFGDAGRADTNVTKDDCTAVVDVTGAFKMAESWRKKRRFDQASRTFGSLVVAQIVAELGWDTTPEKPVFSAQGPSDEEPEADDGEEGLTLES